MLFCAAVFSNRKLYSKKYLFPWFWWNFITNFFICSFYSEIFSIQLKSVLLSSLYGLHSGCMALADCRGGLDI